MAEDGLPPHAVAAAGKCLDWLGPAAVLATESAGTAGRLLIRVEPFAAYRLLVTARVRKMEV